LDIGFLTGWGVELILEGTAVTNKIHKCTLNSTINHQRELAVYYLIFDGIKQVWSQKKTYFVCSEMYLLFFQICSQTLPNHGCMSA
jgi:hypothetical protein